MVTSVSPLQLKRAKAPMPVTPPGIVTAVKPLKSEHKCDGIFSTLSPNVMVLIGQLGNGDPFDEQFRAFHVTEVKPSQPEKAPSPILVTDEGMVIEVKPLNPEHKYSVIFSTLSPNVKVLIFVQLENTP